jgi:hypothetical protein
LSGGVSLGAYQAGYLYYTSLVFHENPELLSAKLLTGSSAGGLNTLLSILSFCGKPSPDPKQSALWEAWMRLKAEDLAGPAGDRRALVPRRAFLEIAEGIREEWNKGVPRSCDIVVGVSATRLRPQPVRLSDDLSFGKQEEKFTLRIRGRGDGRPPLVTNYVNALQSGSQPLLALTPNDDLQNFEALRDLMFATSAFPLVFSPQKLKYCAADPSAARWIHADYPLTCKPNEIEEAEFLDGGILDNRPLGLAEKLSRTGLESKRCEPATWKEIPQITQRSPLANDSVLFLYSDINSLAYPTRGDEGRPEADLLPFVNAFINGLYETSRAKDTLAAFENNPRLAGQVAAAKNLYPRAGDALFGFFGFFERDFRAFDFYLGMYEAREFIESRLAHSLYRGQQPLAARLRLPDGSLAKGAGWQAYRCVAARLEQSTGSAEACNGNRNLMVLADVSLARLQAFCERAETSIADTSCVRLKRSLPFRREREETDFGYTLRLLARLEFEYRDLGLAPEEAASAATKIKSGALASLFRIADSQPADDRLVAQASAPLLFNSLERLPTENETFVTWGPALKLGITQLQSSRDYPPPWRALGVIQLQNVNAWLGPGAGSVSPALLAGFERSVFSLSNSFLQTRARILAGYQYSAATDPYFSGCREGETPKAATCRGFVIQPGFSWLVLERLRLDVEAQALPFHEGQLPWQLLPSLGFQFYF